MYIIQENVHFQIDLVTLILQKEHLTPFSTLFYVVLEWDTLIACPQEIPHHF